MKINGTIVNYYVHCKRQCYLFATNINLEDNSEDVRIGRILHEIKSENNKNMEVKLDNISLDKVTDEYVIEMKKSDSDVTAARMQLLFYLSKLEEKGIIKKGKLKFVEKNNNIKEEVVELDEANREILNECVNEIENLINSNNIPKAEKLKGCKKCAYYEYCYI